MDRRGGGTSHSLSRLGKRKLRGRPKSQVNFAYLEVSDSEFDSEGMANLDEVAREWEAARLAGLPPDVMSYKEKRELPQTASEPESYVQVRNAILLKWHDNMKEYLTKKEAASGLQKRFVKTAHKAHDFLTRYGYINTGVFDNPRQEWGRERVIIIGAGAAGLAAARQLHHLGYKVTVLEARDRVGGRVNTDKQMSVDLGAMVVTGTIGNPVALLCKQLDLPLHPVGAACAIYDKNGQPVPSATDQEMEQAFNKALQDTVKVRHWDLEREHKPNGVSYAQSMHPRRKLRMRKLVFDDNPLSSSAHVSNSSQQSNNNNNDQRHQNSVEIEELERVNDKKNEAGGTQLLQQLERYMDVKNEMEMEAEQSTAGMVQDREEIKAENMNKKEKDSTDGFCSEMEAMTTTVTKFEMMERTQTGTITREEVRETKTLIITKEVEAEEEIGDDEEERKKPAERVYKDVDADGDPSGRTETKEEQDAMDQCSLGRAFDHILYATGKEFSELERQLFDWHVANLEYGCAAELGDVSLREWDQDDQYEFEGQHCLLPRGYSLVLEELGKGLDIRFNQVVTKLQYTDDKVIVHTSQGDPIEGDIALVTLPLGVLQKACFEQEQLPNNADDEKKKEKGLCTSSSSDPYEGVPSFDPPLPNWKLGAIRRMGFGNLNKVCLMFDAVFWDDEADYFGFAADRTEARGECFLVYNMNKCANKPILLALVAGYAAYVHEQRSNEEIVLQAMQVIRRLYPSAPEPVKTVVTRWGSDPFARGSYSYIAVGSSGRDYDLMARPVSRRLFFAGEATQREHPATVAGAFLSGLREAGRIDRAWSGPIEVIKKQKAKQRGEEDGEEEDYYKRNKRRSGSSRKRKELNASLSSVMPSFKKKPKKEREALKQKQREEEEKQKNQQRAETDEEDEENDERDSNRRRDNYASSSNRNSSFSDRSRSSYNSNSNHNNNFHSRSSSHYPRSSSSSSPSSYHHYNRPHFHHQYNHHPSSTRPPSAPLLPSPHSHIPTPSSYQAHQPHASASPLPTMNNHHYLPHAASPSPVYPSAPSSLPYLNHNLPVNSSSSTSSFGYTIHYAQQQALLPDNNNVVAASSSSSSLKLTSSDPRLRATFAATAKLSSSSSPSLSSSSSSSSSAHQKKHRDNHQNGSSSSSSLSSTSSKEAEAEFRKNIGKCIVQHLKTYLDSGRIASKDDFKHLARKLTHLVVEKEQRRRAQKLLNNNNNANSHSQPPLPRCDDKVKAKVVRFVDNFFDRLDGGVYISQSLKQKTSSASSTPAFTT
ncbi:Lysine-specific histone demethylase 1A [Balamuthia mandrillaris]